MNNLERI